MRTTAMRSWQGLCLGSTPHTLVLRVSTASEKGARHTTAYAGTAHPPHSTPLSVEHISAAIYCSSAIGCRCWRLLALQCSRPAAVGSGVDRAQTAFTLLPKEAKSKGARVCAGLLEMEA
jgi:hypothetical protein